MNSTLFAAFMVLWDVPGQPIANIEFLFERDEKVFQIIRSKIN